MGKTITKKKAKKGETLSRKLGENRRSKLCDIASPQAIEAQKLTFCYLLKLLTETIDTAFGIHQFGLASKERMAGRTNINIIVLCRLGVVLGTTCTADVHREIFRMYIFFHDSSLKA